MSGTRLVGRPEALFVFSGSRAASAMEHLVHVSGAQSISTEVPALFRSLLERAAADGHGAEGIASVIETVTKSGAKGARSD